MLLLGELETDFVDREDEEELLVLAASELFGSGIVARYPTDSLFAKNRCSEETDQVYTDVAMEEEV